MKRCKWSKHNDPIYSLAEKHFLLQGQNPTISTELPMKVVNVCCELLKAMHHRSITYSALHLTGLDCTWWLPSVVTVCNCFNLTTEPGLNSSKWQSLREGHRWQICSSSADSSLSTLVRIENGWKWVQEERIPSTSLSVSGLHKDHEINGSGATKMKRSLHSSIFGIWMWITNLCLGFVSQGLCWSTIKLASALSFFTPGISKPGQCHRVHENCNFEGVSYTLKT